MSSKEEKLKAYEASIRQRVQCEEKAFHIINRLIDGTVEGHFLIECGKLISRDHYDSVVEERAITSTCGYPICGNTLKNIPGKKYQICTKTNKVYDISDRKNFCSNRCFQASKFFHKQIPDSPVWVRERAVDATISLLPLDNARGMVGEQVIGINPRKVLEEEVKALEQLPEETPKSRSKQKRMPQRRKEESSGQTKTVFAESKDSPKDEKSEKVEETRVEKDISVKEPAKSKSDVQQDVEDSVTSFEKLAIDDEKSGVSKTPEQNSVTVSNKNVDEKPDKKIPYTSEVVTNLEQLNLEESKAVDAFSSFQSPKSLSGQTQDTICHKVGVSQVDSQPADSKMDRLMKLMAKKKGTLAAMVDVQERAEDKAPSKATSENESLKKDTSISTSEPTDVDSPVVKVKVKSERVKGKKGPKTPKPKMPVDLQKRLSALEQIAEILKTWTTESTRNFLFSQSSPSSEENTSTFSNPLIQKGYRDLCQRLTLKEIEVESVLKVSEEGLEAEGSSNRPEKGIPVYDILKQEADEFQLKVTEFITGKPTKSAEKKKTEEEETPIYFPTVDKYDQAQIRVKIVLDRLDKSLPELLIPLHLSVQDVSTGMRELVNTFKLEKDNIIFRPSEWTLVAIFILKMLGLKDKKISAAFDSESSSRFFTILFKGIGHTVGDVDDLLNGIFSSIESPSETSAHILD